MSQRKFIVAAVVSAVLGSVLFAGYLVGTRQVFPYIVLNKIDRVVTEYLGPALEQPQTYPSIFLNLTGVRVQLPAGRAGNGGGLTSFGSYVVVLTHDGRMYSAKDPTSVVALAMQAPDNHLDDYRSAALEPPFDEYEHNFSWFRYNDIQYFQVGSEQGFLASFTSFNRAQNCFTTRIAKLTIAPEIDDPADIVASQDSWQTLYDTQPCLPMKREFRAIEAHMAGGRIAYDGNGTVYLASGDYHWDGIYAPKALAQHADNDYGKVISIDLHTGEGTVLSVGHRNMQGISIDQAGEVWTVEHGIRGGDELNKVVVGANYGWPEETLGTLYSSLPVPNTRSYGRHDTHRKPEFSWLPSVAVSALTKVKGFHESWDGDLLAGSLKEYALHRIRISDGRVVFEERIPIAERLRYVLSHDEDTIVLWTDTHRLIFLEPSPLGVVAEFIKKHIDDQEYSSDDKRRVHGAIDRCMECHSPEPNDNAGAPSIANMFDSRMGSTSYAGYSDALKSRGGTWTEDALKAYLRSPSEFIPGTAMPDPGIEDEFLLDEIVGALKAVRTTPANWD